jgi:hypothetical protein
MPLLRSSHRATQPNSSNPNSSNLDESFISHYERFTNSHSNHPFFWQPARLSKINQGEGSELPRWIPIGLILGGVTIVVSVVPLQLAISNLINPAIAKKEIAPQAILEEETNPPTQSSSYGVMIRPVNSPTIRTPLPNYQIDIPSVPSPSEAIRSLETAQPLMNRSENALRSTLTPAQTPTPSPPNPSTPPPPTTTPTHVQ